MYVLAQDRESINANTMPLVRQNGVFPCNEPPRSYVLLSSTDQPSTRYPRRHGEDQSRHGWRSGGSWQAQHGASWRRSRSPPTGPRGGYGAIRPYDSAIKGRAIQSQEYLERSHSSTYEPKESFMEKKALARGGDFLRHAFFRTLQKSRDEVRENYSEVDRLLKHVSPSHFFLSIHQTYLAVSPRRVNFHAEKNADVLL